MLTVLQDCLLGSMIGLVVGGVVGTALAVAMGLWMRVSARRMIQDLKSRLVRLSVTEMLACGIDQETIDECTDLYLDALRHWQQCRYPWSRVLAGQGIELMQVLEAYQDLFRAHLMMARHVGENPAERNRHEQALECLSQANWRLRKGDLQGAKTKCARGQALVELAKLELFAKPTP